jgi:hypothetical protein
MRWFALAMIWLYAPLLQAQVNAPPQTTTAAAAQETAPESVLDPATVPIAPDAAPLPSSAAPATEVAAPSDHALDDQSNQAVPTRADAHSTEQLRLRLQQASAESAAKTNLWPWLTLSAGFGTALFGTLVGTIDALSCDDTRCSSPNWVPLLIVAGSAVGIFGTIWLVRADAGIARSESRRYQLERELDHANHVAWQRQRMLVQSTPLWSMRFAL